MISRFTSVAPLLFLALLAAASFWLERTVRPGESPRNTPRHDPDFWAENFSVRRYGPDGTLQNTLTATRMLHFPDDDTTVLDQPRVIYNRQPAVTLSGTTGLISRDGREVGLVGNVIIRREGKNPAPPTEVSTPTLTVYPDDERAVSTEPVTIRQGRSIIHGSGMEFNNGTGIGILHGPVRGSIHKHP